ncbi:MAG: 4Fe-4S dicluster domain-containing protein, partial [Burkholderiales bacterium]|nr:4Fe-4S dicluster domain-containing protein [Burkholderiales bacterium]
GKTNDHVVGLTCVLVDGTILEVYPVDEMELNKKNPNVQDNKLNIICNEILNLVKPVQDEITKKFIPLKRSLSGYNLKDFYTKAKVDLTKIIAGSEGTLAFVTKATLKLLPIPKYKVLVVTHYNSFLDALDDAEFLITYKPLAIETVDEIVQKSATTLPSWLQLANIMGLSSTDNCISNFTEFVEDDVSSLEHRINQLKVELDKRGSRYKIINDVNDIKQLWNIRSLAVGLVGKIPGEKKPVAFVEDALVPPQHLRNFVADFRQMLNSHGLTYAMYGHCDVGCVHVRPALDMKNPQDKHKIRIITEKVIKLTDKYQGLLWGEHGKGYRGEFVEHTFGEILYPLLQKIKTLFDPYNRLNPGKLVSAYGSDAQVTKIDNVIMRGDLDKGINQKLQDNFSESMLCNGNATCFNQDATNVMCPSYKVTGNRIHSPKGRAMLVKDWLRNKSSKGDNHIDTIKSANEAFNAMQGCLGCKGCAGKCPTQVNIPDLKAKFYNQYYTIYKKRSIRDKILANLEQILLIGANFPKLWNFMIKNKLHPSLGMIKTPMLSIDKPLSMLLKDNNILVYNNQVTVLDALSNPVVILLDVFISFLNHEVLIATCNVLKYLGYTPLIIKPSVSGKSAIVMGQLDKFRQKVTQLKYQLFPIFAKNIPVIGLENSIALIYRDEYNKFGDGLTGCVQTLAEFLSRAIKDKLTQIKIQNITDYFLLPHCTEQAICPNDAKLWQDIFKQFQLKCNVINLGCCGMAGTYGHEAINQHNSEQLFNLHWKNQLSDSTLQYMATGYSCRSQTKLLTKLELHHPIEIIAKMI